MEDRRLAEGEQAQIDSLLRPRPRNKAPRAANRVLYKPVGDNDSSTTVHGTACSQRTSSLRLDNLAVVPIAVLSYHLERPATPLHSTTESPQQPPATPVQTATASPAQHSVISISSTEYPNRDAATPARSVTESPYQQICYKDLQYP